MNLEELTITELSTGRMSSVRPLEVDENVRSPGDGVGLVVLVGLGSFLLFAGSSKLLAPFPRPLARAYWRWRASWSV